MQQLKDMLNGMSGKAKPAPAARKTRADNAAAQRCSPRLHSLRQSRKKPRQRQHKACRGTAAGGVCQRSGRPGNAAEKKPEKKSIFQMFGTAEDEKPAARKPEKEDTMSLPLLPLEQDGAPADETVPAPADAAPPPRHSRRTHPQQKPLPLPRILCRNPPPTSCTTWPQS